MPYLHHARFIADYCYCFRSTSPNSRTLLFLSRTFSPLNDSTFYFRHTNVLTCVVYDNSFFSIMHFLIFSDCIHIYQHGARCILVSIQFHKKSLALKNYTSTIWHTHVHTTWNIYIHILATATNWERKWANACGTESERARERGWKKKYESCDFSSAFSLVCSKKYFNWCLLISFVLVRFSSLIQFHFPFLTHSLAHSFTFLSFRPFPPFSISLFFFFCNPFCPFLIAWNEMC